MPSRSQRHVRYTMGADSTGSSRYPGASYTWDWATSWPSGSSGGVGGPPSSALIVGHYLFNDNTVTTSDGVNVTGVLGEIGPKLTGDGVFDYFPQYEAIDGRGSFGTDVLTAPMTFVDGEKYSFFAVASVQDENSGSPNQDKGVGCWRDAASGTDAQGIGMIAPANSLDALVMRGMSGNTSSSNPYPTDGTPFAFGFAMHQNGNSMNAWFSMGDEAVQGTSAAVSDPATAISIAGSAAWPYMLHEVIWYGTQLDKETGDEVMEYLKKKWGA